MTIRNNELLVADGPCLRRFTLDGVQTLARCVPASNLGRIAFSDVRVYVADSFGSSIYAFDALSLDVVGRAVLPGNPDGITVAGGLVYVAADDAGLVMLRDAAAPRRRATRH